MTQEPAQFLPSIEELIESRQFALKVLNASLNGLYIYDVKLGHNVFINSQYTTVTGYTLKDLQSMDKAQFFNLFHPDDQQRVADHMERIVYNSDDILEIKYRFKTKDDRWIWCLSRDSAIAHNENGPVSQFIGTFFDITEHKRAEEKLRKGEIQYRELFETLTQGVVFQIPTDGQIVDANPAAERLLGLSRDEMLGRSPKDPHWQMINEDASEHNLNENPAMLALRTGQIVRGRVLGVYHPQLKEHRWLHVDAVPQFQSSEKQPYMVCVLFTDITERKRAEEALYESNQELNEYAYALTHNLKAPLRAIQNYVNFLFEDLADSLKGEPKKYLEGIKNAVTLSNKQFEDLETLYRIKNHQVNFQSFEMRELLDEIQSIFKDTPDRKLIFSQDWPVFRAERLLLRQILIDLINNGFKFNRSDIRRVEVGWQAAERNGIEIFVRDNGIGIDPQYQQKIFDIFRRLHTESEYEGTGIGLATVKRAVQKIGGKLRVESAVGEGSTFYINLPNSILENNPL